MVKYLILSLIALPLGAAAQQDADPAADSGADAQWLPSLITDTPEEGFELAVTMARRGVSRTQPDTDVLRALRQDYANDADSLTAASQVIAVHFQTIAAANDYWRAEDE